MSIAANRVSGVRAALCNDLFTARMARAHNNANILAMGSRVVGPGLALAIVETFLETPFEKGRHLRRIKKLEVVVRDQENGKRQEFLAGRRS